MRNDITLPEIASRIVRADTVWLITHRRPDGDAVGSAYGLCCAIDAAMPEKTVRMLCADPIPERLRFLAPDAEFLQEKPLFEKPDLVISVDIASRKLFGELERELCEEVDIKIDHHESGDDFAPRAYVDPRASATGEIVWKLIPHLGEVADRAKMKAAQRALYGAISADTGGFRYSNVTAETHRIAAEMIEAGVACAEISHGLFESRGEDEIRATQAGYEALSFHAGGKIAMMVITCEAMVRWNLDEDVLGVISALPREIRGVELGIVLRQSKKYPDTFKISMRSGESVDVSRLCGVFGGGGHLRAAGGEIHAQSPEEAAKGVLAEAIKQFEQN